MASDRRPGSQSVATHPQNIKDGSLALHASPAPSPSGTWESIETSTLAAYRSLSTRTTQLIHTEMSTLELSEALLEKYGHRVVGEAQKYLHHLLERIKGAADWGALNRIALPLLGGVSFNAGIYFGIAESALSDAWRLLGLGKMIILADVYRRMQTSPFLGAVDPITLALVIAAKYSPALAAEAKRADEQLQHVFNELRYIATHRMEFIETVGKHIWKGVTEDWKQFNEYLNQNTVSSEFQAGRVMGRACYQVIMTMLVVLSVAGAAIKLAAKFPTLLRLAGIVSRGGKLEELEKLSVLDRASGTTKAMEEAAESAKNVKPPRAKPESAPRKKPPTSLDELSSASVRDKLDRYLLDPNHPVGKTKADWFRRALGFDKTNAGDLADQIKFDPEAAIQTNVTEFGTKYNQIIPIEGANEKIIDVTFAWIKNNDGVVRLVTAIPTPK